MIYTHKEWVMDMKLLEFKNSFGIFFSIILSTFIFGLGSSFPSFFLFSFYSFFSNISVSICS